MNNQATLPGIGKDKDPPDAIEHPHPSEDSTGFVITNVLKKIMKNVQLAVVLRTSVNTNWVQTNSFSSVKICQIINCTYSQERSIDVKDVS